MSSHELGTPLTSLRLQVETLLGMVRRQSGKNELVRAVEARVTAIDDQVLRLSGLVETLLDVSAIAQGSLPLSPEPLDLSELVQRIVARLNHMALSAACSVMVQTPGPVRGVWDRVRTEQA